jgi:hypothetical protein
LDLLKRRSGSRLILTTDGKNDLIVLPQAGLKGTTMRTDTNQVKTGAAAGRRRRGREDEDMVRSKFVRLTLLIVVSAGLLALCGCSSSGPVAGNRPTPSPTPTSTPTPTPTPGGANALGFVYVAGDLDISEFSIGSDGTLTLLRPVGARSPGANFNKLIVDPAHRFVYGLGSNEVFQYGIAADGTLSEMTPLTVSLGDATVQASDIVMPLGGGVVYVSSNLGVHQLSLGPDGQLHTLGPPVGSGAGCIAINPSGSTIFTCQGSAIDSYKVNTNGTVAFLTTSSTNARGPLAFDDVNDSLLIAQTLVTTPQGDFPALATYAIQGGNVINPTAASTGPTEVDSIFDLSVRSGAAYVVAGNLIVPEPPGGGTNDHLSIYDLTGGMVVTPEKIDTGRGPGRVLALASTGPAIPNPLVYVTNSRDNNVAQCVPSTAPSCSTVAISTQDTRPAGITGFLGSPGK